jgi:hypothetical protein
MARDVREAEAQVDTQSEKFSTAARELGCDESEEKFNANLKKVAAHKLPDLAPTRENPKTKKAAK